mgnify:CR=1 FL=1
MIRKSHMLLALVDSNDLAGATSRERIRGIKMAGPCAKINMVLSEEPQSATTPPGTPPQRGGSHVVTGARRFTRICVSDELTDDGCIRPDSQRSRGWTAP